MRSILIKLEKSTFEPFIHKIEIETTELTTESISNLMENGATFRKIFSKYRYINNIHMMGFLMSHVSPIFIEQLFSSLGFKASDMSIDIQCNLLWYLNIAEHSFDNHLSVKEKTFFSNLERRISFFVGIKVSGTYGSS